MWQSTFVFHLGHLLSYCSMPGPSLIACNYALQPALHSMVIARKGTCMIQRSRPSTPSPALPSHSLTDQMALTGALNIQVPSEQMYCCHAMVHWLPMMTPSSSARPTTSLPLGGALGRALLVHLLLTEGVSSGIQVFLAAVRTRQHST